MTDEVLPDALPSSPQNSPETPRKRGGQPNNVNALRHGGRSSRQAFAVSHLAANQRTIEGALHGLRKRIQAEARRVHNLDYADPLPLEVESAINLAVEAEARRRQLGQSSRDAFESGNEDLGHSRKDEALRWAEKRHAAIVEAMRKPEPVDPWATLLHDAPATTPPAAHTGVAAAEGCEHLDPAGDAVERTPAAPESTQGAETAPNTLEGLS